MLGYNLSKGDSHAYNLRTPLALPPFVLEPGEVTLDDGSNRPLRPPTAINMVDACCWMRQPAQLTLSYLILTHPTLEGCVAIIRKSWVDKFEVQNGLVIQTDHEDLVLAKGWFGTDHARIWGTEVIEREPDFVIYACHTNTATAKLIASLGVAKAYDSASVVTLGMVTG